MTVLKVLRDLFLRNDMKGRKKRFSLEQIEKFKKDANVRVVSENTIRFTYDFRVKMYEAWTKEGCSGIKRVLTENGFDPKELGRSVIDHLSDKFKANGHPTNAKNNIPKGSIRSFRATEEGDSYLLDTGKFVRSGNGIAFSEEFKNELFSQYPEQSVKEGIRKAGIDPVRVGYHRIYALQRAFSGDGPSHDHASYSEKFINKYRDHPYIQNVTKKQMRFSEAFMNEASVLIESVKINEILKVYEIEPDSIPASVKKNLKFRLDHWERTDKKCDICNPQTVRIKYARYQKLYALMEQRFCSIRQLVPHMNCLEKKELCLWVKNFPKDPEGVVNTSRILEKIGLSRTSYYSILKNKDYGTGRERRKKQEEEDIKDIKTVMEYKKFRKGTRQICMMMPDITGKKMSREKIMRLMKKYGLSSGIRVKKQSRIDQRKNLEAHKKANLLKRRFRLARPYTHILTDVTYLPFGDHKLAYCSAIIDAVTGGVYDMTVSETNDLDMVTTSVSALEKIPKKEGAIFHSDQGVLYLNDTFQKKVAELGYIQSMSKRGNCWDNAPQESFFGHFKDECDYRNCRDIEELRTLVNEYMDYFCNERRRWDHQWMTPVQYAKYLNEMSDEDFERYLETEEEKYRKMKAKAEQEAVEHSKTLGV